MPGETAPSTMETALRRLHLCSYAIQEIHAEIEKPADPEAKADLLLATENVAFEVLDLLQTVKLYAWGPEQEEFVPPDDDYI